LHPLDQIEEITGSPAKSLYGALTDTGADPGDAGHGQTDCPDAISEIVADCYALSQCGRLFHWRNREIQECKITEQNQFVVFVDYVEWRPSRRALLDRLFPDRPLVVDGEIDWTEYDANEPIPGAPVDPLREKKKPRDCALVDVDGAPTEAVERARRLFWG